MDIARPHAARQRLIRRILIAAFVLMLIPLVTYGLSKLKKAAPEVESSSIWRDTVKRGSMIRQVRGLGTLVPEEILFVPALNDGRVERIHIRAGTQVSEDSIILVLNNPEVENAAVDAEFQLKAAEAAYTDLRVQLESKALDLRAAAAQVDSDFKQAALQADRDTKLGEQGLIPDLTQKLSRLKADLLKERTGIEKKRVDITTESFQAQLAAQRVKLDQLRALAALRRKQVDNLKIRAGASGVLQQLLVEVGQRLPAGTVIGKVAQPQRLKAELKVQETQAKDVVIGLPTVVDTRNGMVNGRVIRIDPAAINGTVTVDIKLEGQLPNGARPDLSVEGTIELERLNDVIYVNRPVSGQQNALVTLFRLEPDGKEALRVPVRFGRTSVNTIEITEGLKPGDTVVLSDMSAWDGHDRIQLR